MNATETIPLTWEHFDDPGGNRHMLTGDSPVRRVILPDGSQGWLVTGYDEARTLLDDPRLSKDQRGALQLWGDDAPPGADSPLNINMLTSDPPDHTRLRKMVNRAFTKRAVERLRTAVEEIADDLLDAMGDSGTVDLIDAYAFPLPVTVISELYGVPVEHRDDIRRWTAALLNDVPREVKDQASTEFYTYLSQHIAAKRADPGDDLLSHLVQVSEDGSQLTETELISLGFLIMAAGHETTVGLISNAVYRLLRHPEQLQAVREDPDLLLGTVNETLRYESPIHIATVRYTIAPVSIGEVEIPAGEFVQISLAAANRDGNRFADPDLFDITRETAGHLAFGHGIHYCVGAPLARMEGEIALRKLLDRFPQLDLGVGAPELRWRKSLLVHGLRTLPIRYSRISGTTDAESA